MEYPAIMAFHQPPDVRLELSNQIFFCIKCASPKNSFNFGADLCQHFVHHILHDELAIYETAQKLEWLAFSLQRMENNYVFLICIENNTIDFAPSMYFRKKSIMTC